MLLVDSVYINNSGGRVLLNYLVKELNRSGKEVFYLFDERCIGGFDEIPNTHKVFLRPSLIERHKFYRKNKNRFSKVLCFGNIPPTIRLKIPVYTYFHNVLLASHFNILSWWLATRVSLKKLILQQFKKNSDYFIVQTNFVKNLFVNAFGVDNDSCIVLPFYDDAEFDFNMKLKNNICFLYVSDGNQHKNHLKLLEAWKQVNAKKPELRLILTVSGNYPELQQTIQGYIDDGCNIENCGLLSKEDLAQLYRTSKYIVYPSLAESFGLGLIEGVEHGCDVIASDLEFVHAVIEPYKTFNPLSATDIADKILSANLGGNERETKLKVRNEITNLIAVLTK
jgi:glycosyltransferase involved in cell wall biosynthesis